MYVLNRDSKNNVTISSPLEAHKSQTIVLTTEGLDVGYDNPIFACLELNYAEADRGPDGRGGGAHGEAADVLPAGPGSEPRDSQMERGDGAVGEPAGARCQSLNTVRRSAGRGRSGRRAGVRGELGAVP